jgi:hypothetical protein
MRDVHADGQQDRLARLPAGGLEEVGCGAHEQGPAILAAERAGEAAESLGGVDLLHDLAPGGDADAARAGLVGRPDVGSASSVQPSGPTAIWGSIS